MRAVPGRLGVLLRRRVYERMVKGRGDRVVFSEHVVLQGPKYIELGNDILINRNVSIQGGGGVKIGNDVMIGPEALIWSINHEFSDTERPMREQGYGGAAVRIEDDVWIGAGSIILPGVHIGRGAIVAAGSVVTGSVSAEVLVAGVPAKVKRHRQGGTVADG